MGKYENKTKGCTRLLFLLASSPGLVVLAGCSSVGPTEEPPGTLHVSKAEMGKAWPFTVEQGEVCCQGKLDAPALIFTHQGKAFAINGLAMTWKVAPDLKESGFWADDPAFPGSKLSIGPLQEKARSTCSTNQK